jgi:hypothetical protein
LQACANTVGPSSSTCSFNLRPDATHVYTSIDLARLTGASKPTVVVTAADLVRAGTRVPEFYAGDLFCPVGRTPIYLGQPVALLIFEEFDAFDQARLKIRDGGFVKFAEETGAVVMPDYGAHRFTRVAGPTPEAPDVYSPVLAGWVSPGKFQNAERQHYGHHLAPGEPPRRVASKPPDLAAAARPELLAVERCVAASNYVRNLNRTYRANDWTCMGA